MLVGIKDLVKRPLQRFGWFHGIQIARGGYLEDVGWVRSKLTGEPVDAAGAPLPWLTYPAIGFLAAAIPQDARVFEWGSGASTAWFAGRASRVVSCEHDPAWYRHVCETAPPNAEVHLNSQQQDSYVAEVTKHGEFDLVLIDGRRRVDCARAALDALSRTGVIVWDNTDVPKYRSGLKMLADNGFRRVDFTGLIPSSNVGGTTSVLYRDHNCLGL